jgi:hypothetical protein
LDELSPHIVLKFGRQLLLYSAERGLIMADKKKKNFKIQLDVAACLSKMVTIATDVQNMTQFVFACSRDLGQLRYTVRIIKGATLTTVTASSRKSSRLFMFCGKLSTYQNN